MFWGEKGMIRVGFFVVMVMFGGCWEERGGVVLWFRFIVRFCL